MALGRNGQRAGRDEVYIFPYPTSPDHRAVSVASALLDKRRETEAWELLAEVLPRRAALAPTERVLLLYLCAAVAPSQHDLHRGLAFLDEAEAHLPEVPKIQRAHLGVECGFTRASHLGDLGRFDEAGAALAGAEQITTDARLGRFYGGRLRWIQGSVAYDREAWDDAERHALSAYPWFRAPKGPGRCMEALLLGFAARAAARAGRHDDAGTLIGAARRAWDDRYDDPWAQVTHQVDQMIVEQFAGSLSVAVIHAQSIDALDVDSPPLRAWVDEVVGSLRQQLGEFNAARERFERALDDHQRGRNDHQVARLQALIEGLGPER